MVTTSNQSLIAIPAFMRFISTYPDPQEVCEALISGPLAHFNAKSVNMFLATPANTFKIVGTIGITAPLVPRYIELPRTLNTPLNDAVIEGETGVTVDGRNPSAIARAVTSLFDDPIKAKEMGQAGRSWIIDKWRWEIWAKEFNALFK